MSVSPEMSGGDGGPRALMQDIPSVDCRPESLGGNLGDTPCGFALRAQLEVVQNQPVAVVGDAQAVRGLAVGGGAEVGADPGCQPFGGACYVNCLALGCPALLVCCPQLLVLGRSPTNNRTPHVFVFNASF